MPVRIYDIAKKYNLKPKDIIVQAKSLKELGLAGKNLTASSTLDKVTAEYLEQHLDQLYSKDDENVAVQEPETTTITAEKTDRTEPQSAVAEVSEDLVNTQDGQLTSNKDESVAIIEESKSTETIAQETTTEVEIITPVETQLTETLADEKKPVETTEIQPPTPVAEQKTEEIVQPHSSEVLIESVEESATSITTTENDKVSSKPDTTIEGAKAQEKAVLAEPVAPGVSTGHLESQPANATVQSQTNEPQTGVIILGQEAEKKEDKNFKTDEAGVVKDNVTQTQVQSPPPKSEVGAKVGSIDISKFLTNRDRQKPQKPAQHPQKKQQHLKEKQQQKQQPAGKQQPQQKQQPVKQFIATGQQGKKEQPKPQQPAPTGKYHKDKDARAGKPGVQVPKTPVLPPDAPKVLIKPPIIVRELANSLGKKPFQIIAELLKRKLLLKVNDLVDEKIAQEVAASFGINLIIEKRGSRTVVGEQTVEKIKTSDSKTEDQSKLKPRPPVVTIMGHVDHGKTTLLDAIRKSNVVASEAGGITQHIGAYTISFPHPYDKKKLQEITFIDTPGHAAFSAMRARGANVTDIVILVVAADDGVMPQTIEALNHAREAKVPIIVAVNKCDHPNANPSRIRDQLSKHGLTPEEWGGDTIYVDISALKKQGIDQLLEMILIKAEMMELKANPDCPARGNVIESGISAGGPTATLLVRRGTLKVGDIVVCKQFYGKVRALINDKNQQLKEAKPSHAVKVLGLNGAPEPGSEFEVVEDLETAREIVEKRLEELKEQGQSLAIKKVTLETLLQSIEASKAKVLKVVLKADTQGSAEAISTALKDIKSDKVSLEIIHSGVGAISESDVMLASAAKGIIIGFHTRLEHGVADIAKKEGVQIKLYSIIYELIDEVKKAMAGLLEPVIKEVIVGRADVKKVFELSKGGKVAGCMVSEGTVSRNSKVRVYRGKDLMYDGVIASLRHFQEEVNEVRAGMECGIRIEGFNDFKEGDIIQCYNLEKTLQSI